MQPQRGPVADLAGGHLDQFARSAASKSIELLKDKELHKQAEKTRKPEPAELKSRPKKDKSKKKVQKKARRKKP